MGKDRNGRFGAYFRGGSSGLLQVLCREGRKRKNWGEVLGFWLEPRIGGDFSERLGIGGGAHLLCPGSSVVLSLFFIITLLRRRIRLDLHLIKGH